MAKLSQDCIEATNLLDKGIFTISLDFELYWGVRDKRSINSYFSNLQGVPEAIKKILNSFEKYEAHATWAIVGFVLFENLANLKESFPKECPKYKDKNLCSFEYIERSSQLKYDFHFSPELIRLIQNYEGQEIGSHTFSHYYCLEDGHDLTSFTQDIKSMNKVTIDNEIKLRSFIFPRNQINVTYLSALSENGITSFRGNESSWLYSARPHSAERKVRRIFRIIDAYCNISGHNTYDLDNVFKTLPFNIPSSRFLRPVSKTFAFLDKLRLKRITNAMTFAARNNQLFHLWWHPHNFGVNLDQNILFLDLILQHYVECAQNYNMTSLNMHEISSLYEQFRKE